MGRLAEIFHLEREGAKKVIYMDVGSWQCREGEGAGSEKRGLFRRSQQGKDPPKPFMTFGLIEHNAVALCSYFPLEEYKLSPRMREIFEERDYEFEGTLMERLLTRMMRDKYFGDRPGMDLESVGEALGEYGQSYHVRKLICFKPDELLDNRKKLIVLIPDLHLHYFKDTTLDNFVTSYESVWDDGKPVNVPNGRRSMEKEFITFCKSILAFREEVRKEGIEVEVRMLGDVYEMWESLAAFHFFRPTLDSQTLQDRMGPIREWESRAKLLSLLTWFIQPLNRFPHKMFAQVKDLDVSKWEPEVFRQMAPTDKALRDWAEIHEKAAALSEPDLNRILPQEDSPVPPQEAALNLADAIAEQYGHAGTNLKDLLQKLQRTTDKNYTSNHDDFLHLATLKPLTTAICGHCAMETAPLEVDEGLAGESCNFIFFHGHELCPFNSDKGCACGFLITSILVLLEASNRGDLFKHYQYLLTEGFGLRWRRFSEFEAEKRATMSKQRKQVKKIARMLQRKDAELNLRAKHLIVVQAHTHVPYLRGITGSCWKARYRLRKPKEPCSRPLPAGGLWRLAYDELDSRRSLEGHRNGAARNLP